MNIGMNTEKKNMLKYEVIVLYSQPPFHHKRIYFFRHGRSHRIKYPSELVQHKFMVWCQYGVFKYTRKVKDVEI